MYLQGSTFLQDTNKKRIQQSVLLPKTLLALCRSGCGWDGEHVYHIRAWLQRIRTDGRTNTQTDRQTDTVTFSSSLQRRQRTNIRQFVFSTKHCLKEAYFMCSLHFYNTTHSGGSIVVGRWGPGYTWAVMIKALRSKFIQRALFTSLLFVCFQLIGLHVPDMLSGMFLTSVCRFYERQK